MKTTFTLLACALTYCGATAQKMHEADVPESVKSGFAKHYPEAKVEKWEKEGLVYEAEFDLKKVESSAVFDENGIFIEIEQEMELSQLPQAVTDYCTQKFPTHKIVEATKITDSAGKVMYEAEVGKGKEQVDLVFDDKGNFVKAAETETGEEEKD